MRDEIGGPGSEDVWRGGGVVVREVGGVEAGGGDGVAVTDVEGESATVFVGADRLTFEDSPLGLDGGDDD